MSFKRWALNILIELDCLINVIFGGELHETLSARWGKMLLRNTKGWLPHYACGELDKLDPGHCIDEAESEGGYEQWKN